MKLREALPTEMFTVLCANFFIWTMGRDGVREEDNYWYLLPAIREGKTERNRGRSSTPTLLIRIPLSAPCPLNERWSQNTHTSTRQRLCSPISFLSSYLNQTIKLAVKWLYCTTLDFAFFRGLHNILSMIHNYRNWMSRMFLVGADKEREKYRRQSSVGK